MSRSSDALVGRLHSVCIVSLGVWTGALLMTGAAAAIAFPTMRTLQPALLDYPILPAEHWSIAAGHVMRRVFGVADIVQLAAGGLALVTLAAEMVHRGWRNLRLEWRCRAMLIVIAAGLALFEATVLAPRMNSTLDVYWAAARAGEVEEAAAAKARFDPDHVLASRLMVTTLSLVALAAVWTAIAAPHSLRRRP